MPYSRRNAFSLIELAVVITIIALVIGGIMGGQSLLKAQRLRAVLTDANSHVLALQQFQQQYSALPGDMANAQRIWGNAQTPASPTVDCAAPLTTISGSVAATTSAFTCNGNGDGIIDMTNAEEYRAWQQLAAGGFVVGAYPGVSATLNGTARSTLATVGTVTQNVPAGAITGTAYSWDSFGIIDTGANASLYDGDYNNALVFGAVAASAISHWPAIGGRDAFDIDSKADDGRPALGNIRSYKAGAGNTPNCAAGTTTAATYNATVSLPVCSLIFMSSYLNKSQK